MENKRTEETPQSVIANVHEAVELLKERGSEALVVFSDPKSGFNDRDAYLFIIDVDKSLVVSNPRFPERTGGNIREHLDCVCNQVNHRQSQKTGHDKLFDSYRNSVGEIVREYTNWERGGSPSDSNEYFRVQ